MSAFIRPTTYHLQVPFRQIRTSCSSETCSSRQAWVRYTVQAPTGHHDGTVPATAAFAFLAGAVLRGVTHIRLVVDVRAGALWPARAGGACPIWLLPAQTPAVVPPLAGAAAGGCAATAV